MSAGLPSKWFELAFVHNDVRVVAAFRARRDAQTALDGEVRAVEKQMRQGYQNVCRVEILPLEPSNRPGTAVEAFELLLENTRSSLEALGEDENEERQDWARLKALAEAVDDRFSSDRDGSAMRIDFVWNNGGMDDNLCSMNFAMGSEETAEAFAKAFQALGEKYDLFYDCGIGPEGASPLEGRLRLNEVLAAAPQAFAAFPSLEALLEKAAALEQEAELSETLMMETHRGARPRM